jgi:putative PIN family toxin of toxin-antitoxin system
VGTPAGGQIQPVKSVPRVVLDTNVVLSALLFSRGKPGLLREAWQQQQCVPLVSRDTADELMRVLTYPKFRLTADEQQELLADFLPYSTVVRLPSRLPELPACRDPKDLPFLLLATVGKAKYLVSGDKDLLAVIERMSFRIVRLSEFLEMLASE